MIPASLPNASLKAALLLLALLLGMSACLPKLDPGPGPDRVRLNPAMPGHMPGPPVRQQLAVAAPKVMGDIDNDRIALIFHTREVRYLSDTRWAWTLGPMFQALLVEALESTNALAGVGDESTGMAARIRLATDIRRFALAYSSAQEPPVAEFAATFRLLDVSAGGILATRQVEIRVPATGQHTAALVDALEQALEKALGEAAPWVVESLRGRE